MLKNHSENMRSIFHGVMQSPSPQTNLFCFKYILIAVFIFHVMAELPAMLSCGKRLEHVHANHLYCMTFGSYQKALIWIPFLVKHITKCLCFRWKNKCKFSMVKINFLEWNRPSRKFSQKRLRDWSGVTLRSYCVLKTYHISNDGTI